MILGTFSFFPLPYFPCPMFTQVSFCHLKVKSANIHNRGTQHRLGMISAGSGYSFIKSSILVILQLFLLLLLILITINLN